MPFYSDVECFRNWCMMNHTEKWMRVSGFVLKDSCGIYINSSTHHLCDKGDLKFGGFCLLSIARFSNQGLEDHSRSHRAQMYNYYITQSDINIFQRVKEFCFKVLKFCGFVVLLNKVQTFYITSSTLAKADFALWLSFCINFMNPHLKSAVLSEPSPWPLDCYNFQSCVVI